ncbi:putative ABC transport system permease protein [Actinomadura pelletieri DSM 43383]|uniref:Putative ABC transport system permease protein n=1 Tax=Actinomadura pelletieri DSM 43383 TaxID=1120940 RepID=A0A495QJ70_9ACTN|nr:CRISPR-associated protein Cas5 [Actinomadura pelletieri]RKS72200.1 putative ABC transport system permease protein [Actinomadura pelletieri DSM 43383]
MRGPALRSARAHLAPLGALAVLMLVAAVLAVVVPSRTATGYDRAAEDAVEGTDLRVEGKAAGPIATSLIASAPEMQVHATTWQTYLPPSLRRATGEPEPSISTARLMETLASSPQLITLTWDEGAAERIRIVRMARDADLPRAAEIGVMISKSFADRTRRRPGDPLVLLDENLPDDPLPARIVGVYEAKNAADPYWTPRPSLLKAQRIVIDKMGTEADFGSALIESQEYSRLVRNPRRQLTFTWRFPIRSEVVTMDDAMAMAEDVEAYRSKVHGLPGVFPATVETVLDKRLEEYKSRLHAARSVLGLAFGGLVAVAAGVLLLAAGLLGERLRPVLGTMRARGASLRQLAMPVCGVTALAVVPAGALGYAVGRWANAGPPQYGSALAVGVLVAAVLILSGAMVLRERGGGLESSSGHRDDLGAARPTRRRPVLEAMLVAVAVGSVVLLRRRGGGAAADPLISAVPVLLGVALAVLVLRAYPYLLRAAGPFLRRRRGAVAFLGLARASRQSLVGVLPLVVLLLAASVAGFTATVDTALRDGQERASWAEVGADARIEAGPLDEAGLRRIRAVPGVTGAVRVRVIDVVTTASNTAPMTVVGADLAAYRALAPDVPGVPASGVLASPLAARGLGSGAVTLSRSGMDPIQITSPHVIDHFPGRSPNSPFFVVPFDTVATATGFPSQVFVTGHDLDARALSAAAPGREIVMRRDVLRDMTGMPLVSVVRETFRNGALISGVFGLLAVLLVLIVGARARGRTVAHLRALGLSRRQSHGLALVEIAPVLLCAVGAGWALGLLLPEITGPAVDLDPYTGGHAVTAHVPGPAALLGLLGALLLAAAAAVAVDRVHDTRPGTVLRTGE